MLAWLVDLSKLTTLFKSKFGMLVLTYLTLVGNLYKVWLVILQGTLVDCIEFVKLAFWKILIYF